MTGKHLWRVYSAYSVTCPPAFSPISLVHPAVKTWLTYKSEVTSQVQASLRLLAGCVKAAASPATAPYPGPPLLPPVHFTLSLLRTVCRASESLLCFGFWGLCTCLSLWFLGELLFVLEKWKESLPCETFPDFPDKANYIHLCALL